MCKINRQLEKIIQFIKQQTMTVQYTKQIQSVLDDVISSMEEWDGKILVEAYENHVLKHDINLMEYVKTQYKELLSPVVSDCIVFDFFHQ